MELISYKVSLVKALLVFLLIIPGYVLANNNVDFNKKILMNLDITSFDNSFGPKQLPKGTVIKNTEYNVFTVKENVAYVSNLRKYWVYSLQVVSEKNALLTVCFTDKSLHGTYYHVSKLELKKVGDRYISEKEFSGEENNCKPGV